MSYHIFPLGDTALTIDFGNIISPTTNDRVQALATILSHHPFEGLIEGVPAYSSLTIFYNITKVRHAFAEFDSAFAAVEMEAEKALAQIVRGDFDKSVGRLVKIPVCYEPEFALDLEFVAKENNLRFEDVARIHVEGVYRVFMIGFLPGFPYLGEVNEKLAVRRKSVPRSTVPSGSVGLAGSQTGIYSLSSPGGWQIIGKTPLVLFDPANKNPSLLRAGDRVQFYQIDRKTFAGFASGAIAE